MRTRFLSAAAAALSTAAFAADPPVYLPGGPAKPSADAPTLLPTAPPAPKEDCPCCLSGGSTGLRPGVDCLPEPRSVQSRPRFYGGLEYVLFWFDDRTPPPLVASAPANLPPNAGPLIFGTPINAPGVTTLYGGTPTDFGAFNGLRGTVGYWLDCQQNLGIEAAAFLTEQQAQGFAGLNDGSKQNPNGLSRVTPSLIGPVVTSIVGGPGFPGGPGNPGVATVTERSRLWGAEFNGVAKLAECDTGRVDLLAGFRYLDLDESLGITGTTSFPFPVFPAVVSTADEFTARSQFYGAQLGVRGQADVGRLTMSAAGKLAFGVTHEAVGRGGITNFPVFGAAPPFANRGGAYVTGDLIGRATTNKFAALPEALFQVGYRVTERLDVSVGYNVLYLTNAVRAADQVNDGFAAKRGIDSTDFVAQGVSFGLGYRY